VVEAAKNAMRITFLLPGYVWAPSGGPKVVYEYANRLVRRGHEVAVIHPRRLEGCPKECSTAYQRARASAFRVIEFVWQPSTSWHPIDPKVRLLFPPTSHERYIPDADVIFATSWQSVASVLRYQEIKGQKCYLIQGYEIWRGEKDLVDETWRTPLHKVVVSGWLKEVGEKLGCNDITYIPNAIDHKVYRVFRPIDTRPRQIAMMFSRTAVKGSMDGIKALEIAKQRFPEITAVFFSTSRIDARIPHWIKFYRNPPQNFLIHKILNDSSIFVSPSLSEGFSLPPAEASACGCAVVATDTGGVREYLENGFTALLSPPGDPEQLAANICRLLENDGLRLQLAERCNSAVRRLDWETSTALLERFLSSMNSRITPQQVTGPLAETTA
jgi:L-malate glycosyltransferase